jgi:hypothetical protein
MSADLDETRARTARYVAGDLPLADAQRLEAEFQADPTLGARMGIHVRLERLYRLLENDPTPEPRPLWWQDRRVAVGAAAAMMALLAAVTYTGVRWNISADRVAMLEARTERGLLEAATITSHAVLDTDTKKTHVIRVAGQATRVDMKLALRTTRFNVFRATLTRTDGVTVFVADRLQRDSNGQLGLSFNTSAVPPDTYAVTIEGLTYRGDREPVARAQFRLDPSMLTAAR